MQCKTFSHFFNKKYWRISDINSLNFTETLTNDVISFVQLGLLDPYQMETSLKGKSLLLLVANSFLSEKPPMRREANISQ